MNELIRKISFLNDKQYGQIVKMIFRYADGEEINETFGDEENIFIFNSLVRKDLDKILKERERKRGKKNG